MTTLSRDRPDKRNDHQQGAAIGDNPKQLWRPSHGYHSYATANARGVLSVDANSGDEHQPKHSAPSPWAPLDRLPRENWRELLRGDAGFGDEAIMAEAQARESPRSFKQRRTASVRRAKALPAANALAAVAGLLHELASNAELLTDWRIWRLIPVRGFKALLEPQLRRSHPRLSLRVGERRLRGGEKNPRCAAMTACARAVFLSSSQG